MAVPQQNLNKAADSGEFADRTNSPELSACLTQYRGTVITVPYIAPRKTLRLFSTFLIDIPVNIVYMYTN